MAIPVPFRHKPAVPRPTQAQSRSPLASSPSLAKPQAQSVTSPLSFLFTGPNFALLNLPTLVPSAQRRHSGPTRL